MIGLGWHTGSIEDSGVQHGLISACESAASTLAMIGPFRGALCDVSTLGRDAGLIYNTHLTSYQPCLDLLPLVTLEHLAE